jgi:hypothetical protein
MNKPGGGGVSGASLSHEGTCSPRRDADDIRVLIKHLELTTADDVLALCAGVFPDEGIPDRARLIVEDVLGDE